MMLGRLLATATKPLALLELAGTPQVRAGGMPKWDRTSHSDLME
jgi:hypothetical protein